MTDYLFKDWLSYQVEKGYITNAEAHFDILKRTFEEAYRIGFDNGYNEAVDRLI